MDSYLAMKKLALFFMISLLGQPTLWATTQVSEYFEYEGQRVEISAEPLESYALLDRKKLSVTSSSSACWRGYVGIWKITDKTLFLISLHQCDHDAESNLGREIPLTNIFPDSSGVVPAKWFSGSIRIPVGKNVNRRSHAEFDHYLTIEKGSLVATTIIDNKGIGATRSTSDLKWVTSTLHRPRDEGDWIDARILARETPSEGQRIITRGICYPKQADDAEAWLMIPRTRRTANLNLTLSDVEKRWPIKHGCHVEVVVTYSQATQSFVVNQIRELLPGESIHHPQFEAFKSSIIRGNPKLFFAVVVGFILTILLLLKFKSRAS